MKKYYFLWDFLKKTKTREKKKVKKNEMETNQNASKKECSGEEVDVGHLKSTKVFGMENDCLQSYDDHKHGQRNEPMRKEKVLGEEQYQQRSGVPDE